jgi:nicotinamide riboside kinase
MATINVDPTNLTVCLTGPESSGKSTLAYQLGELFAVPVVAEVARDYLAGKVSPNTAYDQQDLLAISRLQQNTEQQQREHTSGLMICDTDLLVVQIWCQEKFGEIPDELTRALDARTERVYLLATPDLVWEPDPLRENPEDRQRLFELYLDALESSGFRYSIVSGTGDARLHSALEGLNRLRVL